VETKGKEKSSIKKRVSFLKGTRRAGQDLSLTKITAEGWRDEGKKRKFGGTSLRNIKWNSIASGVGFRKIYSSNAVERI